MGVFTLDYGAHGNELIAAFSEAYNYQSEVDDGEGNMIPNPETEQAHAKRQVREYVKTIYRNYKGGAVATAQAAVDSAKADIVTEAEDITVS